MNQLVCEALPFLSPTGELKIVHQTGLTDYLSVKQKYQQAGFEAEVIDFIQDMPAYFARADLILSRAGASSVAEIAAAGRPSILIPLLAQFDLPDCFAELSSKNLRRIDSWRAKTPS